MLTAAQQNRRLASCDQAARPPDHDQHHRKSEQQHSVLRRIEVAAELVARALGETGYRDFQAEKGVADVYTLSANQAEAIVSMQLGSLANLERETLRGEHANMAGRAGLDRDDKGSGPGPE